MNNKMNITFEGDKLPSSELERKLKFLKNLPIELNVGPEVELKVCFGNGVDIHPKEGSVIYGIDNQKMYLINTSNLFLKIIDLDEGYLDEYFFFYSSRK